MADSDVQVRFGAQIEGLVAACNEAKEQIAGITAPISEIKSSFGEIAEVISSAFAIDKIIDFEDKFAEAAEQIDRISKITGVSTTQVQDFQLAMKMAGGDAETAGMTINILQKNIGDAISKAGPARAAFEGMGVSLEQLKSTDVITLLFEMKQRLDEAGSSAEQSALKQEYLRTVAGRQAAQFLALNLTLDQVKKLAAETGAVMSPGMVAQGKELADSTHTLSAAFSGLANTLGGILEPMYDGAIKKTTKMVESTNSLLYLLANPLPVSKGYQSNKEWTGSAGHVSAGGNLGEGQFGPNKQTNPLPPLETGKADDSAEKEQIAIEKSDLETKLQLYRLDVAAKKDADDEKVAAGQLSRQAELADLINMVSQERDIALQEITDERNLYDRDSAEWEQLNNKKLIVAKQYANELAKLNEQIAQANAEQVKKTEEAYKGFFDTIDRDMDTVLAGILQGTETWQAAMAKAFSNLATSLIEEIAKLAVKWAAFDGSKAAFGAGDTLTKALGASVPSPLGGSQQNSVLGAAITKLAGLIGLNTAAHSAGTLATTTNTVATTADATATAGSTVATTAGTVATAANTTTTASSGLLHIAALAENTVATVANTLSTDLLKLAMLVKSFLPSFDVGSYSVPSDMIAQIHAGEMIIPASQAEQIRSGNSSIGSSAGVAGVGSGGGQFTININAIDTQTGIQFLKQHASVIAQTLNGQARNFNPAMRVS